MEITFVWSWLSFFSGVGATIVVGFWLVFGLAFKQWKKTNKQRQDSVEGLFRNWPAGSKD